MLGASDRILTIEALKVRSLAESEHEDTVMSQYGHLEFITRKIGFKKKRGAY